MKITLKKQYAVLQKAYAEWLAAEPSAEAPGTDKKLSALQKGIVKLQTLAQTEGLDGLALSATIWSELLASEEQPPSDTDVKNPFLVWLEQGEAYIGNPNDPSLIQALVATLPEALQTELTVLFGMDDEETEPLPDFEDEQEPGIEHSDNVDFAALESILREPDESASTPNTVLDVILEQVAAINPLLLECTQEIKSELSKPEYEQSKTLTNPICNALSTYIDHINTLIEVAEAGTLRGFSAIFAELIANCHAILEEAKCDIQEVNLSLEYFPSLLESCLRQPEDDTHCLELIKIFESGGWSKPLYYADSKRLLYSLVGDLEFASGNLGKRRKQSISAEDTSLTMSEDVTQEMINTFFTETPPLIEKLVNAVSNIHSAQNVRKRCSEAQRLCHTLKGSANLIGVQGIANFAHYLEDILQFLSDNNIKPSSRLALIIEEAVDRIAVMLEVLQGHDDAPENQEQFLAQLLGCANQVERGELSAADDSTAPPPTSPEISIEEDNPSEPETVAQSDNVRIPRKALEEILDAVSETAISLGQIEESLRRLRDNRAGIKYYETVLKKRQFELEDIVRTRGLVGQQQAHAGKDTSDGHFDSLEIDEYNELYSAVQGYIEVVSDSVESAKDILHESTALENVFALQKRLNRKMQSVAMSARMVPISDLSPRLKRIVRQTCRATDKQAELIIEGDSLMLDANIFNQLAAPLMHLLRNAVDHGIVSDKDEHGKNSEKSPCRISLSYEQMGNFIQIRCADEGRGLDYDRIRKQAIERGFISESDTLEANEVARLIFQPSLSTRRETTQVSGRGIGLDVVRDAIMTLNGSINVYDNEPSGTVVECKFPVPMITEHCVLVEVEREVYAIATSSLVRVAAEGLGQLVQVDGNPMYQAGDEQYPIKMLAPLVGYQTSDDNTKQRPFVILNSHSQMIAIGTTAVIVDIHKDNIFIVGQIAVFANALPRCTCR